MSITQKSLLVLVAGTLLASCGGGGGGTTGSNGAATFAGKVIDGYVAGAKVCIDLNSNAVCDTSEPSATTDSTGSYSFTYSGSVAGMHIIAEVPVGAVDSDLGTVTKTYSLFAPAASASVVTPLSTLVSSEMIANKSTAAVAEQAVKTALNLTSISSLVGYDFKSAGDTSTTAVAQVIVAAIANTSDTMKNDSTYQTANISAGDTIKQAITQVKNNILPQVMNVDGTLALSGATAAERIAQINTIATTTISGRINNIVAATKSGDGSVANMAEVFKRGFILTGVDNGKYKDSNNNVQYFSRNLQSEFIKYDVSNLKDSVLQSKKVLIQTDWFSTYEPGSDWFLEEGQWKKTGAERVNSKWVFHDNCVDVPQTAAGKVYVTACAIAKDLSSKKMVDFIPNICKDDDGNDISGCNTNSIFPSNSVAYDLTLTYPQDTYWLWIDETDNWTGYNTVPANSTKIVDLIAGLQQYPQYTGNGCNTAIKVVSYDASKKSGKIGWASTASTDCTNLGTEYSFNTANQTNFDVITSGVSEIMRVEVGSLFRVNNPGNRDVYRIFTYFDNGVKKGFFTGNYLPVGAKLSIPFTGDPKTGRQVVSPVLFDALLSARKLTPFPYLN